MKNRKIYIVFGLLIVLFSMSLVTKSFQNDTFFTIKLGQDALENGISNQEKFTWHEGLEFHRLRWAFDVIIASLYNNFGYIGIYVFTMIIAGGIGLSIFYVSLKLKNNIILATSFTLIAMYISSEFLCARGQIISYLLLILEVGAIEKLIETQKTKYSVYLIIICIALANFHASVLPLFFVFFLPYIMEYIVNKTKIFNVLKFKQIEVRDFRIKKLLITMFIALIGGLCSPIGVYSYTYMFKVMSGESVSFIAELEKTKIMIFLPILWLTLFFVMLLFINGIKINITDICLLGGLYVLALIAVRNIVFFYMISGLIFGRMIMSLTNMNSGLKEIEDLLNKNNKLIIAIIFVVTIFMLSKILPNVNKQYVNEKLYPVEATEYIKNNLDVQNIKLFNHFNFGSYLEFNEIPVFIDSRSEIYCEEFNDTTILKDWNNVVNGKENYKECFEKYGITHVLLYKNEIIAKYICYDPEYIVLYEDNDFILYEKIQ